MDERRDARAARESQEDVPHKQRDDSAKAAIAKAEEVAKNQCDVPKAISEAWADLRGVGPKDNAFQRAKSAAKGLERCRRKTEAALDRTLQEFMRNQRQQSRNQLDKVFLEMNMDVAIEISGSAKDRITLSHVFFSNRAVANKLLNDDDGASEFSKLLRKLGFKRVQFTDGLGTSYGADLNPEPETGAGRRTFESMGVRGPLALPYVEATPAVQATSPVAPPDGERSPAQNLAAIDGADHEDPAVTKRYAAKLNVLAPRCKASPDVVANWIAVAWKNMREAGHPTTCLDLLQGLVNGTDSAAKFGDRTKFCVEAMAAIVVIATAE